MRLGLRMGLNSRGAGGGGDIPSLNLQFAADKTLTARKGPTPTFTRASTATFIGSNGLIQSAAINAARFDHDPVTFASRGLLIEESRTNSFQRSDDFGNAYWTKGSVTVTSDNTTSPDGTNNADSIFEVASTNEHILYANSSSLTEATLSIFVKGNGRNNINIRFFSAINNWIATTFSLSGSGSVTQTSSGPSSNYTSRSQTITQLTNGWYRCTLTASRVGGVGIPAFDLSSSSTPTLGTSGTESYAGNASLGIHLWGAQLEQGSFPTSYIPTTTASVVRSADVCSIDGSNFASIWNGVDGTMFFRGSRIANQSGQTSWSLSSSTSASNIALDRTATTERISVAFANLVTISAFTTLAEYKVATALKPSDYAVSFNGASALTSSNSFALTLNKLSIGMSFGGNVQLNGWIHSMKFYKKRLANAKLQSLSA
jgi:hypothetical protein